MSDTIITHETFNIDNLFFEKPKQGTVLGKGGIKFSKIYPKYRYPNGQTDKVYIQTPELFSWGIHENKNQEDVSNYTFSFVMHDRNEEASKEQQNMINIFEQILERIKIHLKKAETKEDLNQFQLDSHVDMMDIFYRKKDKGQLVSGASPILYPKLQTKFGKNRCIEITTDFRSINDEVINPYDILGVRCMAAGNIVLDNIFIVSEKKPIIQLKLDEVIITDQFKRMSRLRLPTTN